MRMNAADTNDSIATADWTPLTVVSKSRTTAEIETFMNEVSMTNTNIAIASTRASRRLPADSATASVFTSSIPSLDRSEACFQFRFHLAAQRRLYDASLL